MRRYGCPYCPASIGGKANYLRHVGVHERNGDRPRPEPLFVPGAPRPKGAGRGAAFKAR